MRVGVFGATGQVGQVMRDLLEERDLPVSEMRAMKMPTKGAQLIHQPQ